MGRILMRYAIISDIHSNIQALEESLNLIDKLDVDKILCLGDIVGYNANPKECLQLVKKRIGHSLLGNHDALAYHEDSGYDSNMLSRDALDGIKFTRHALNEKEKSWLKTLAQEEVIEDEDITFLITHGSPLIKGPGDPRDQTYILSHQCAVHSFRALKNRDDLGNFNINLCFFGHTHIPTLIRQKDGHLKTYFEKKFYLNRLNISDEGDKAVFDLQDAFSGKNCFLINVGAIGQPRQKTSTSFGILDTDEKILTVQKFTYNIKSAQEAIYEAGYSKRIAERLKRDMGK